jgi:hypothetical protein
VSEVMTAAGIAEDQNATWCSSINIWDDAIYYCELLCEKNKEGESCSQEDWDNPCTAGELFCDFDADDIKLEDGTCKKCPTDPARCYEEGFAASDQGRYNCKACTLRCKGAAASKLWIDGQFTSSQPLAGAIQSSHQNASGLLYDCSILAGDSNTSCHGAEGKICLVHFDNENGFSWHVGNKAEKSGCTGVIAFIEGYDSPLENADTQLLIPYVYIEEEEGKALIQSKIESIATIQVDVFGALCDRNWAEMGTCRENLPCDNGVFCYYQSQPGSQLLGPDVYSEGSCFLCPIDANGDPDPLACYFDDNLFWAEDTNIVQNVNSCASSCGAEAALLTKSCKFCPSDLTKFQFGIESKEERCIFCPQNDLQFPDRIISLFGDNITCYQIESFFQRLPVPNNSSNCQLAQSMNYICGCGGIILEGVTSFQRWYLSRRCGL